MPEKTYVPLIVKSKTTSIGEILKCSAKAEELIAFVKQHAKASGWINFDVLQRKNLVEGKPTHNAVLDTWEPKQQSDDV